MNIIHYRNNTNLYSKEEFTMFENEKFEGIHYSRFIASWVNATGKLDARMRDWLRTIEINGKEIPESVIRDIWNLATNGKLELEANAEKFIENYGK